MGKSLSSHLFQMLSATFCGGGRDWGNTDSVLWLAEVGGLQSLNSDWSIGCLSFLLLTQSVCLCPCQRRSTKHINNQFNILGQVRFCARQEKQMRSWEKLFLFLPSLLEVLAGQPASVSAALPNSPTVSHNVQQSVTVCCHIAPVVTLLHTASQDPSLNLRNFAPMSSIYYDRTLCFHQKCIGFVFHPVCNAILFSDI